MIEKHKCKLCSRSFSNGRALGGHMRSHMMNLPIPEKAEDTPPPPPPPPPRQATPHDQLSETESASSSSSSEEEEDEEEEEKGVFYGLRENPKRSIRLVDPEFSFAVDAGSVVLQDRESETESSKNPTRRRSKRTRNLEQKYLFHHHQQLLKLQEQEEPEPVSSISDTTTEEDVAFCLMMLSRDQWKKKQEQDFEEEEQEQEQEDQEDEAERSLEDSEESEEQLLKLSKARTRGKYKCETCNKTFRSYQALGGHRASHKKIKLVNSGRPVYEPEFEQEKKIHECPVCFRVFASGQALGGHKRTHVTGSANHRPPSVKISAKLGEALIDLNLPAPMDDDDISQIELSAVSDAEFVNPIRQ